MNEGVKSSPVTRVQSNVELWPDVTLSPCAWGGWSVYAGGVEFARLLPCGLLDVLVTDLRRERLCREGRARAHRFWPESNWVTVNLVENDDFGVALALLVHAYVRVTHEKNPVGQVETTAASPVVVQPALMDVSTPRPPVVEGKKEVPRGTSDGVRRMRVHAT